MLQQPGVCLSMPDVDASGVGEQPICGYLTFVEDKTERPIGRILDRGCSPYVSHCEKDTV